MPENIKQIAMRIRELREIAGLTIESLAGEFKISPEQYRKYESGDSDIPVSFLYEVAHRFNVELTALVTGEEPRLKMYSLVRAGKAPSIERRKEYKYLDLAYNFIHKKAEVFLVTVDPKDPASFTYNYHPGQEFNYVLEGRIKVILGGTEIIMSEGDSIYYDPNIPHGQTAANGKPGKFLTVILHDN
jgi:quercetin dioxygenase-like cupin family protein